MRFFDIFFSFMGLIILLPLLFLIYVINLISVGSPLFKQNRVGMGGGEFVLIKFRTMKVGTASVGTHLVDPVTITKFGRFLRRTKLDELPQLWNVLIGEMSLVGPRPCLTSQVELIQERFSRDVFNVRPGITGLAQIQNIDMSTPKKLATVDAEMLAAFNLGSYFYYIFQTTLGRGQGDKTTLS